MRPPKPLADVIAALIEAHRAGAAPHDWQQEAASHFRALGVYADLGGVLMLRPDGEVLSVGWVDEVAFEPSPGWRAVALAAASDRFPELAALAPERPSTAHTCRECEGSGCPGCFGMGWRPDVHA